MRHLIAATNSRSAAPGTTDRGCAESYQPSIRSSPARWRTAVAASRSAATFLVILVGVGATAVVPAPIRAQVEATDRDELLEEAHDRQEEFERFRGSRIPVERSGSGQRCDEQIGRICIWFGGDDEALVPAEFPEVVDERRKLIGFLLSANQQTPDRWLLGQLVHYLVEDRNIDEALRVATDCGIAETWWCSALRGYVLHVNTDFIEAETAFREALASMPPDEHERWFLPRYILTNDGVDRFERAGPSERERLWELFWRLSDPLFLINGNDRLTDHYARLVVAANQQDAAHPQQMVWGDDLEATLIRYGRIMGYSRTFDPIGTFARREDTRQVIGHHHPKSRGYLFPEEFLESPSDIRPESWITAPREARTWYAPPYAPEMRALETQVGRFRRDQNMFVVGAYRPAPPEADEESEDPDARGEGRSGRDAGGRGGSGRAGNRASGGGDAGDRVVPTQGKTHAAFFLMPLDGSEPEFVRSEDAEGVFTLYADPGRYVSGLEVVDLTARHAWRARQGVEQEPLEPGGLDVSDILILKEGTSLPASLDEAIRNVRPGVHIRRGERFPIVWEAYGLSVDQPVQVTIGFTRGRPGFLTRVGEFLGVIEPERPVEVSFADPAPGRVQTAFRSIELELPELDAGDYTLHLRLEVAGREPVTTSRPIIVE